MKGFEPKTFPQILSSMATWVSRNCSKITNFEVGGVTRTILEAVSSEIHGIYITLRNSLPTIIENSISHSFGISREKATCSKGYLTISFRSSLYQTVVIEKGTQFFTYPIDNTIITFKSTEQIVANYGDSVCSVPVECLLYGTIGNVPASSIINMASPIPYIESVHNEFAFTSGRDAESAQELKNRFSKFVTTLSKGTMNAIEYGVLKVPGVAGVYIEENVGYINVYAHDDIGELPSDLKEDIDKSLIDYRCGGIEVVVKPVVPKGISIDVSVVLSKNFDATTYKNIIRESITQYIQTRKVSESFIKADLIKFVMNIDENAILNVRVLQDDIAVNINEILKLDNLELTIE